MKKIIVLFFLILSTVSFSSGWEYHKEYRYDGEGELQQVFTTGISRDGYYPTVAFSSFKNNDLILSVGGNFKYRSRFTVKVYVDDRIIETLPMVASNNKFIQGYSSTKLVRAFKNGREAIIAYPHLEGNTVIKINLNGFENNFNKMRNFSYK